MMAYRYQHGIIGLLCVLLGGMLIMPAPAQAAESPVQAEYLLIRNQFATIEGVLYKQPGRSARIGLVITHPFAGTSTRSLLCPELAAEGFDILCFNNRFSNNQQLNTDWENIALDVAAAVQEMRDRGYRNVVIYGHSAGGPTMAYYQNVAERGNAAFKGGNTLTGFLGFFNSDASEKRLPPADGVM
jgi:pimeloyl-ACP methyl ester carboxylesterase